jgi:hypothetical protein
MMALTQQPSDVAAADERRLAMSDGVSLLPVWLDLKLASADARLLPTAPAAGRRGDTQ